MGFSRYFLRQNNFLLTKVEDKIDDNQLREHVIALNKEPDDLINLRELADCRNLKSVKQLTVQGTVECASLEKDKPGSKLVILVPDSSIIFGMARAYQMFSENHRNAVKIFHDFEEALKWLADDEKEVEILRDFINET